MPGRTRKTPSAVRRARNFAPSPSVWMKNDSIAPGVRPTAKSTASSGKNTPSPNDLIRKVTTSPAPPAITPAPKRYQGRRRTKARTAPNRPATPAEEARRPLQFMPQPSFGRSEEHTSELQSHVNLVCRLLLEKKKK